MSASEKPTFGERLSHRRVPSLEVVKLFSKHGPGWMLVALMLVLFAPAATTVAVVVGVQLAMSHAADRGPVQQSSTIRSSAPVLAGDTLNNSFAFDLIAGSGGLSSQEANPQPRGASASDWPRPASGVESGAEP